MKRLLVAIVLTAGPLFAQGFAPVYPCLELSVYSSCAKSPYLPPPLQSVSVGLEVSCDLKTKEFTSHSSQTQAMQQDCVFGQCRPIGYGFIWYLTHRTLSSPAAPRILFSTDKFVGASELSDNQEVIVSFQASQSFFESSADAVNRENAKLNQQSFRTTLGDLKLGIHRQIQVGVLAAANAMRKVTADLVCVAHE